MSDTPSIPLLDHGHLRLVDHMGNDLSIVRNARVSYDAEWRTGEDAGKDEKLIRYLWKNNHVSPFEAVTFTFDVKAPIFVFRQWHRHSSWAFNEVSARYTELPEEFYVPEVEQITTQSTSNKQMRTEEIHPLAPVMAQRIAAQCKAGFEAYHELLRAGCPRELARGVLPMNCYSHMFATANLRSIMHFIKGRIHKHAQYEVRVYAAAMLKLIEPIVPVAAGALIESME